MGDQSGKNNTQPTRLPEARMLLSSLAEFWSLIEPLLVAAKAGTLCEVGTGRGEFTLALIDYCKKHSGHYTGIDPRADISSSPNATATFIRQSSLEALAKLPAQDVYFLDGDHNYHTVRNELRLILENPPRWPLVILHDVCWPWARRDQYCDPSAIPANAQHPNAADLGMVPGRNELGEGGFSGGESDYPYTAACHEGGPRNGVLTAVEDFLREPAGNGWRLLIVPAIFGLGLLYAPQKCSPETALELERLEKALTPLRVLLENLEHNRVDLFLAYLRHVRGLADAQVEYQKLHQAYQELDAHTRGLQSNYEELLEKYAELRAHTDNLEAERAKSRKRRLILGKRN